MIINYQNCPLLFIISRNYYIVIGVLGGIALLSFFILLYRILKRKNEKRGLEIEKSISENTTWSEISHMITNAYLEEKYQHGVIYLFYKFRLFCKEKLTIRSAMEIDVEGLVKNIAGTPNISLIDIQSFVEIYSKALYSTSISSSEFKRARELLDKITSNYLN